MRRVVMFRKVRASFSCDPESISEHGGIGWRASVSCSVEEASAPPLCSVKGKKTHLNRRMA